MEGKLQALQSRGSLRITVLKTKNAFKVLQYLGAALNCLTPGSGLGHTSDLLCSGRRMLDPRTTVPAKTTTQGHFLKSRPTCQYSAYQHPMAFKGFGKSATGYEGRAWEQLNTQTVKGLGIRFRVLSLGPEAFGLGVQDLQVTVTEREQTSSAPCVSKSIASPDC